MPRRSHPSPDPIAERELAIIDRALAGEPVGPDARDLETFVHDLRALRPDPAEDFLGLLDRRVEERFSTRGASAEAREGRSSRRQRYRLAARRSLLPAISAAASVLVMLLVVASILQAPGRLGGSTLQEPEPPVEPTTAQPLPASPERSGAGAGEGSSSAAAPEPRGSADDEDALGTAPVPPTGRGRELPGRRDRRVEHQASVSLTAPADELERVADEVVAVVDRVGGIVLSSSVQTGDRGHGTASFDLRVPTAKLDEALSQLSKLAHVRSRSQSSQDVTAAFLSTQERLRESEAERQSLLRRLAQASTETEAESARARLAIVNREIEARRADLARARERTDFSTISLVIEADDGRSDSGPWTPADALRDAIRVLEVIGGILLVSAAVIVPIGALGLGAGWAVGRVRRRRREQALDAH